MKEEVREAKRMWEVESERERKKGKREVERERECERLKAER